MLDSIYHFAKYTQHCYGCYFITLSKSVSHKSIPIHGFISRPDATSLITIYSAKFEQYELNEKNQ